MDNNYENEFNDEPMERIEEQLRKETESQKESTSIGQLGVPEEKYEIHDSDVEKDKNKEEIYQHKLEKLDKEDEDKYDFDLPDDFENKRKENEPKEESEEDYTEPKEEIEDNYEEEFEQNPTYESKQSEEQKSITEKIESEISNHEQAKEKQSNSSDKEESKEITDDITSKDTKNKKHMKFENLNPKSLRILFDMTSYIGENQPEDLFNDRIYEQLIKTKKKENMVELISSEDFFDILVEHKVIKEYNDDSKKVNMDEVKDNLKELL